MLIDCCQGFEVLLVLVIQFTGSLGSVDVVQSFLHGTENVVAVLYITAFILRASSAFYLSLSFIQIPSLLTNYSVECWATSFLLFALPWWFDSRVLGTSAFDRSKSSVSPVSCAVSFAGLRQYRYLLLASSTTP